MYEMGSRKPEPTFLRTQGIFNPPPPHHKDKIWKEVAFDDAVSNRVYTAGKWIAAQLNSMAMMEFEPLSTGSPTQCFNQLS